MKPKIAVVQFDVNQFSPEDNLRRAEEYIRKAASKEADIVIFPEDFITGPILGKENFVDFDGKYMRQFQELAKKYSIDVIPGSWIEGDDKGWYNTAHYIDSAGEVKGSYRKINLWHPERKYLTPGNEICVFDTKFGKVGLIICWDLIFPEVFRKMIVEGANLIFCPSYWSKGDCGVGLKHDVDAEINNINNLCCVRAVENNIVLVFCNAAGRFQYGTIDDKLIGRSQIAVPFKGAVKRLDHNRERMFVEEIDFRILKDGERAYKIREDLEIRVS